MALGCRLASMKRTARRITTIGVFAALGLAGRAYSLLAMYRHTGVEDWLLRARQLGEEAALALHRATALPANSLFKGDTGVALLAADLAEPGFACLPLFESEVPASPTGES
jgi:hypothetical protein